MKDKKMDNKVPFVDLKDIPSRFATYKLLVDNPLISYRPYKFGELKTMGRSLSQLQMIDLNLEGIWANFDKELITMSDFSYIIVLRQLSTFGSNKYNLDFECTKCETENTSVINTDSFDFKELAVDFPITANISDKELEMMPFTVKDLKSLIINGLEPNDENVFASQCKNMSIEEFNKFVDEIYLPEDMEAIKELAEYMSHDLKPFKLKCKNKNCNHVNNIKLDLEGGVAIRPFRENTRTVKDKFRFGVKK